MQLHINQHCTFTDIVIICAFMNLCSRSTVWKVLMDFSKTVRHKCHRILFCEGAVRLSHILKQCIFILRQWAANNLTENVCRTHHCALHASVSDSMWWCGCLRLKRFKIGKCIDWHERLTVDWKPLVGFAVCINLSSVFGSF